MKFSNNSGIFYDVPECCNNWDDNYYQNSYLNGVFNTYNFKPKTTIIEGVKKFIEWYKDYNKLK